MNPCAAIRCPHFRFVQGVASYCAHRRFAGETGSGRTTSRLLSAPVAAESTDGRTIEVFPRRHAAPRTAEPEWCPLRGDFHCARCRAVYLDTHEKTATAHHAETCNHPLEKGDAPAAE